MSVVVDVPKDGNCVLHAIALAYLCPRKNTIDDDASKLFGTNSFSSRVRDVIRNPRAMFTVEWLECVQTSRRQLVQFMKERESMFTDVENYTDSFMPHNEHFFRSSTFDEYLSRIEQPGTWLGSLEIRAFSSLLQSPIVVKENDRIVAKYGELYSLNGTPAICLVLTDRGTHYKCEVPSNNICSSKRKEAEPSDEDLCSRSSSLYDEYVINAKRMKLDVPEPMEIDEVVEEFKASGVKRALHGTIFQLELLMLYAARGKERFDFRLATEMDAAEKFDDVVFQYKDEPRSRWKTILLQAKHKQDVEKNKITARELTTWTDDSFSLQKYFVSFCKIKSQPLFEDADLEQFVICTNTDFDLEPAEKGGTRLDDSKVVPDELKARIKQEGLTLTGTLLSSVLDAEQTINKLLEKEVATVKPAELKTVAEAILIVRKDEQLECELNALTARRSSSKNQKTEFLHMAQHRLKKVMEETKATDLLNSSAKQKLQLWQLLTQPQELDEDDVLFFDGEDHVRVRFKQDREAIDALSAIIKSALEGGITQAEKKVGDILSRLAKSEIIPAAVIGVLDHRVRQGFHSVTNTVLSTVLDAEKTIKRLLEKGAASAQPAELKSLAERIIKVRKGTELERELAALSSRRSSNPHQKTQFLQKAQETLAEIVQSVNEEDWLKSNGDEVDGDNKIGDLKMALGALPKHIDEFVAKFQFVTKYPDVDSLNSLIGGEVGVDFNLLNASLITRSFEKTMLDWLKQKLGTFITKNKCELIFSELKTLLNSLMTAGLGKAYPEKLGQLEVTFSDDSISQMIMFLQHPLTKQIFHLVTEQPKLGALKVLQALKKTGFMQREDDCIFMRLKTLTLPNIQRVALDAFSSSTSHFVMVIVCRGSSTSDSKPMLRSINSVLKRYKAKRLMLVSAEGDSFASKFGDRTKIKMTDKTTFDQLDSESQDRILGSTINFQGKHLELDEVLDVDSASDVMTEDILLALAEKECLELGNARYRDQDFVEDFYVPRRLHLQRIKPHALNSQERFFITNVDVEELVRLGVRLSKVWNVDGPTKPAAYSVAVTTASNGSELFRKISEATPWNVHWLDYDDGGFYWVASKNDWTGLQIFIEDNGGKSESRRHTLFEGDLIRSSVHQRVVLVADNPGKGKSTFVSRLASRMKDYCPRRWVVRLNFNDYGSENHPQSLNKVTSDVEAATDYFTSLVVSDGDVFSRNVLHFALTSGKVELFAFFDGLDEVAPTYKDKAITLLQCLGSTKMAQLYITTRPHVKADLEKALRCPAYVLNLWGDLDKIDFIARFWAYHLSHKEERFLEDLETLLDVVKGTKMPENIRTSMDVFEEQALELFKLSVDDQRIRSLVGGLDFSALATLVLTKWNSAVPRSERTVMDIPLHLKMYAEIIFMEAKKLMQNFNLLNLYSDFVEYKLNIFYMDKRVIADSAGGAEQRQLTTVELTKVHQGLAAKMFFPNFDSLPGLERLEDGIRALKSHLMDYRLPRVGLVQRRQADVLHFVHRSFGEYFLCQWLTEYLSHACVQKILLRVVLMESNFMLTSYLFDDYVSLNWNSLTLLSLKESVIRDVIEYEAETFFNNTVLHVAALREHLNVIRFLIDKFKNCGDQYSRGLLDTVNSMQYTPLQAAAFKMNTGSFALLLDHHPLEFHKTVHDLTTVVAFYAKINIEHDVRRCDILLAAVRFAKTKIPLALKKLLLAPCPLSEMDPPDTPLLHSMAWIRRHHDIAALLQEVNNAADLELLIMATDKIGRTALAVALEKNASEVVRTMIEGLKNHPDLLKRMLRHRDNQGNVLQVAVRLNNVGAVAALLNGVEGAFDIGSFRKILTDLVLARNYYEKTIFYSSLEGKRFDCIILLLGPFVTDPDFYLDFAVTSTYSISSLRGISQYHQFVDVLIRMCRNFLKVDGSVVNAIESTKVDVHQHVVGLISGIKSEDGQSVRDIFAALGDQTRLKIALEAAREGDKNILNLLAGQNDQQLSAFVLEIVSKFPNTFRSIALHATKDGETIFHAMAAQPNVAFLTVFLLDINADLLEEFLTARNMRKQTCIHVAAASGQLQFIKSLVDNVQRRDLIQNLLLVIDANGFSPLELSAAANHTDTFIYLLEVMMRYLAPDEAVNLLLANTKYTETALYAAVRCSCRDIVSALIRFIREYLDRCFPGALKLALSHRNDFEYSWRPYVKGNVLFAAVEATDPNVIPLLIDAAADVFDGKAFRVFVCDTLSHGSNVVHHACMDGSVANLKLLLEEVAKHVDRESILNLLTSIDNTDDRCLPLHRVAESDNSKLASFILSFGEEHLAEDVERMMFATNVAGNTPLQAAAQYNSRKTFQVLLRFAIDVLEGRTPGTLRRLLKKVNSNDSTLLNTIVSNSRKKILDVLIGSLRVSFRDILAELMLVEDKHGRHILFSRMYGDELEIKMMKQLLSQVDDRILMERLLIKEDHSSMNSLEFAYWEAECEEDCYVKLLKEVMSDNGIDATAMLLRARDIASKRDELRRVAESRDIVRVRDILRECDGFKGKLLLHDDARLLNDAILSENNVEMLEAVLDAIKDDKRLTVELFLQSSCLKWTALNNSHEMVKVLVEYARYVQDRLFLSRWVLQDVTIQMLCHKDRDKYADTIALLKKETNQVAVDLLGAERTEEVRREEISQLTDRELWVLKNYVESNEYNGASQEDILMVIKAEMRHREE